MTATTIVDQAWEFGSAEWCQFAGELGVRLLAESDLDLDTFEWGFSEIYTHLPERLMAGRDQAAFHFHITGGKVYGGAGAPEENLALPGFHITCPWAAIAHASSYLYDFKGQRERGADEEVMWKELTELTGKPKGLAMDHQTESEGEPLCVVCGSPDHERPDCPVWPPGVGEALSVDVKNGGGLHNLTAKRLMHSPELAEFPKTKWGVPIVSEMSDEQKARFVALLGY
jgi:hypothetical protein